MVPLAKARPIPAHPNLSPFTGSPFQRGWGHYETVYSEMQFFVNLPQTLHLHRQK
jgi:hypothetical protein